MPVFDQLNDNFTASFIAIFHANELCYKYIYFIVSFWSTLFFWVLLIDNFDWHKNADLKFDRKIKAGPEDAFVHLGPRHFKHFISRVDL